MLTRSRLIIFSIIAFLAFGLALFLGYLLLFGGEGGEKPVGDLPADSSRTLEMWGLFDDSDIYEPAIRAYEEKNPSVSIRYKKFIWDDYEDTLINALASGRGPDIFMVHNTWLGKHKDKLAPLPGTRRHQFVSRAFEEGTTTYAFPLFIDNLALFYNKDLFAQEGFFDPPQTWDQFVEYSKALTRFSSNGSLVRSGAALGSDSETINRATDIFLLFLLQNGVEPFNKDTGEVAWKDDPKKFEAAKDALRFYTSFSNPSSELYTWDERQPYSIDAFWSGSLAMMLNYAYNIETIEQKAPYLNFATASLPRKGRTVSIANHWGLGVSQQSASKEIAWNFLNFFFEDEYYIPYINQTGRLAAKDKILQTQKEDPLLKPFVDQAQFAQTPYQPDEKRVQDILDEMISTVANGERTYDQALQLAADRLGLLIK